MNTFIKQYKGKAYQAVPKSRLLEEGWNAFIKEDGNYVQIHYDCDTQESAFFTSGGKQFTHTPLHDCLVKTAKWSFIAEAEYIGQTDGTLGSRRKCSLTSHRTQWAKGNFSFGSKLDMFIIFDLLSYNGTSTHTLPFSARHTLLLDNVCTSCSVTALAIQFTTISTLTDALAKLQDVVDDGHEGIYLFHNDHIIKDRGRSNLAIKLKAKPTGYAVITGTKRGEKGKAFEDAIGSIQCKDEYGVTFHIASGLSFRTRCVAPHTLEGIVIKFAYESKSGENYNQPHVLGAGKAGASLYNEVLVNLTPDQKEYKNVLDWGSIKTL